MNPELHHAAELARQAELRRISRRRAERRRLRHILRRSG